MRHRSVRVCVAMVAAATAMLAGCSNDDDPSEPTSGATTPAEPSPTEEPTTPSAEPFDPRDVDLANTDWTFAIAGWEDEPAPVTLSDGTATISAQSWDGEVELGEDILYVDMDGDGDEDVVASLAFSAEVSADVLQWVATSWYVWLNGGSALSQIVYPLEGSGDCADADPVITAADGGGVTIEQKLMPIEGAVCAEGATIPTTRTVVLQSGADGESWLVQTEPAAAWGGDCPFVSALGYDEVDLVVAPDATNPAPAEGTAGLAETSPTWIDESVPGWRLVGFTVNEQPELPWYCGWQEA